MLDNVLYFFILHSATSYRHDLDTFIIIINDHNHIHQLDKIEKYKWEIVKSLQNVIQFFCTFAVCLSSSCYFTVTQVSLQVHEIQSILSLLTILILESLYQNLINMVLVYLNKG